jgi:hypothetical protein
MRAATARAGFAFLAALLAGPAHACTLCDSVQAMSVRARLLAHDLWWNACAVALPLVLLLVVIGWIAYEPDSALKPKRA